MQPSKAFVRDGPTYVTERTSNFNARNALDQGQYSEMFMHMEVFKSWLELESPCSLKGQFKRGDATRKRKNWEFKHGIHTQRMQNFLELVSVLTSRLTQMMLECPNGFGGENSRQKNQKNLSKLEFILRGKKRGKLGCLKDLHYPALHFVMAAAFAPLFLTGTVNSLKGKLIPDELVKRSLLVVPGKMASPSAKGVLRSVESTRQIFSFAGVVETVEMSGKNYLIVFQEIKEILLKTGYPGPSLLNIHPAVRTVMQMVRKSNKLELTIPKALEIEESAMISSPIPACMETEACCLGLVLIDNQVEWKLWSNQGKTLYGNDRQPIAHLCSFPPESQTKEVVKNPILSICLDIMALGSSGKTASVRGVTLLPATLDSWLLPLIFTDLSSRIETSLQIDSLGRAIAFQSSCHGPMSLRGFYLQSGDVLLINKVRLAIHGMLMISHGTKQKKQVHVANTPYALYESLVMSVRARGLVAKQSGSALPWVKVGCHLNSGTHKAVPDSVEVGILHDLVWPVMVPKTEVVEEAISLLKID